MNEYHSLRRVLFVSLTVFVVSGCGAGTRALSGREPQGLLAAAGGEEEVWGFLPKPAPPAPPKEASAPEPRERRKERPKKVPRRPRKKEATYRRWWRPRRTDDLGQRIGFRGGLLLTASAEEGDWGPSPSVGLTYRWARGASRTIVYDLAVDFASVERGDEPVSSNLYVLRGEALFGAWNTWRRTAVVYVLGGAQAVIADSAWETENQSSKAAGIEVGVGLGSASGGWDLRAVYSVLAGSENVTGNLFIAAGFSLSL